MAAPGLEGSSRHGWEDVADLLEGRPPAPMQGQLGRQLSEAPRPQWAQVDLHTGQTRLVRLRVVSRPDRPVAELLVRLGLDLPATPKSVQNVVEKNRA